MVVFCTQTLSSSLPSSLPVVLLFSRLTSLTCSLDCHVSYSPSHLSSHHSHFSLFSVYLIFPGSVFKLEVATLPFASPGQQSSHPWSSTMMHLCWLPPPQPCCAAPGCHSFALCLPPPPVPLRASPGLVAVGSTRASHTVTWHSIYRPSEGVALGARSICCL